MGLEVAVLRGGVLGQVAAAKDAAVDLRHQGLHAAIEDFRKAGVVGDLAHRHAGLAQGMGGAACGEDFHAARRERLGEGDETGLVGNRDQRAADPLDHVGAPCCGAP